MFDKEKSFFGGKSEKKHSSVEAQGETKEDSVLPELPKEVIKEIRVLESIRNKLIRESKNIDMPPEIGLINERLFALLGKETPPQSLDDFLKSLNSESK